MRIENLKKRMKNQEPLLGTFIRTPSIEIVEILAETGIDFACLDAEHFAFDRSRMDACLAVGRALDLESRGLRFDSLWRQVKKTAR